ncbi:NTPase, partial [Listeria monocytogenes]|nr:NTPase [Listeria monocytogenes]
MKSELTFIDLIDTSEAEKKFLELLEQKKTYFLNGPWGSGKTTFLENVEKIERKKRNWRSQKKFIFLDLWNLKDDRSTIHIAASRINRKIYLLFRMA